MFTFIFIHFLLSLFIIISYMFSLCSACSSQSQGPGLVFRSKNKQPKFYTKATDLKQEQLLGEDVSLFKVQLCPKFNQSSAGSKPFVDFQFPPEVNSLGDFQNFHIDKWKRLSDITLKASLFGDQLQVNQSNIPLVSSCLTLTSCLACLAQKETILSSLLSLKNLSPNGMYDILLRSNGQIRQITIDDFVPVNQSGNVCFTPPLNSGIWSSLIEKARAKAYGSYQKMVKNSQDPKLVFQQITWAPSYLYRTSSLSPQELWQKIHQAVNSQFPCLSVTSSNEAIKWNELALTQSHYYNLLDAQILQHKLGSSFRVLKLRNCFKNEEYKGQGSISDTLFWQQIEPSSQKSKILSNVGTKQGIIFMLFTDYVKYFQQTVVNHFQKHKKYLYNPLKFQKKPRGSIYELTVKEEGIFHICLDQSDMYSTKEQEYQEEGFSRVTMIVAKNNSSKLISDYQYVDGLFKYNEGRANLKVALTPGNYVLYIKLDPTVSYLNLPSNANLIIYSKSLSYLKQSSQSHFPDFLKLVFASYGRANKRQFYNNDQMWSSWKLISQCGFGFISFGNSTESTSKFVITIDQEQLSSQNYKLKKPFKGKGLQQIHINPGQQKIILLRVVNSKVKDINFPPPIKIQIQSIHQSP